MTGYNLVNLKDVISELGENRAKEIISEFSCPLNADVEYFLKSKAIEFSKQGIAQTHLVFVSYKDEPVLVGYFTLSNKVIVVPKKNVQTAKWRKRINRFAYKAAPDGNYIISAPLIGQLGKNFSSKRNELITGDILLKLATDMVSSIQNNLGGKFVYLECEDKNQLVDFYGRNGFVEFGHRDLEKDERDKQSGNYLVQLLKYLS